MRRPIVVFPEPGGPQKTIELMAPFSIESLSGFPGAMRCCCPTTSSRSLGRMRAASGCAEGGGVKRDASLETCRNFLGIRTVGNPFGFNPVASEKASGDERYQIPSHEVQRAPREEASLELPVALRLEFGDEIRCPHI